MTVLYKLTISLSLSASHLSRREEEREWEAKKSALDSSTAGSVAFIVFFLLILDFAIPSWVLGAWFYVINVFLILGIIVGVYDLAKS